jgi:hypothetical protein
MSVGSFSTGNYLNFGDRPQYNIAGPLSISAWLYVGSTGSNSPILSKWNNAGKMSYFLTLMSGNATFYISQDGTNIYNASSGFYPSVSKWVNVMGIYTGSSIYVSVSGVQSGASVSVPSSIYTSNTPLLLGTRLSAGVANGYFSGSVSDVRMYNRALSLEEQAYVANMQYNDNLVDGLVLRTAFNTSVGRDHSQYANHATVVGSPVAYSDPYVGNIGGSRSN